MINITTLLQFPSSPCSPLCSKGNSLFGTQEIDCKLLIPLPQGSTAAGLGYWLSLARTQGKEWLSLTILAERSSVLLFALITDESPVWPLLTGRLPNFFWILATLFPYSKSGKPLCVPVALYNHFLFLSSTSKVTCRRHKPLNYVIEKMQWAEFRTTKDLNICEFPRTPLGCGV